LGSTSLILPAVRLRPSVIPKWALAAAAAAPLFVWWLGWYPGFASSDTIDQFTQVETGVYHNIHPAIHTLYLGLLSQGGVRPGLVTLFQLLALAALLAYAAKWLVAAGVPTWLAVGVAWLLGLSPAVAPTTLALWKDVPFALLMLWAWIELLALAIEPERSYRPWPGVRLGLSLAGVWLFRGNGPITVLLVWVVVVWIFRRRLRFLGFMAGTVVIVVVAVVGPLYSMVGVEGSAIEPAQVFLPDVAGSYHDDAGTFTPEDLALMEEVAPLDVWSDRYDCYDSTPLLFDPEFDQTPVLASPGEFRDLELGVLFRDFGDVLVNRLCTANFVYSPPQPEDAYFHRPPYDIPANEVGLARDPKASWAFDVTDRIWRWAEIDSRLWLTWRPAILLLPALAAVVLFAFRDRRLLLPSSLLLAHTLNVMATSPAQEYRYVFPLYLMAALTLTLIWPTFRSPATQGSEEGDVLGRGTH
jgi:Family of unknown function (DUF6020)